MTFKKNDVKIGKGNPTTLKILCYFKKKDLLVIYPSGPHDVLTTPLYWYVNLYIHDLLKDKNIGDIICDDNGNTFLLLEKKQ